MTVDQVNIAGMHAFKAKDNTPISGNADRPITSKVTFQRMQPKTGQRHIGRFRCLIKAVEIEERILTGLKGILLGNEHLIDAFATEFKAEVTRLRKQRGSRDRQIQRDINRVNAGIKRCLTYITEGDGDPGLVRDELKALEVRKRDLDRAAKITLDKAVLGLHPNTAELYRKKVTELRSLLNDEDARDQAMALIRSMIDHIEVHKGADGERPEVILVGALTQILAYTQTNKTAASNGSDGRVLIVAGVGFEPAIFSWS